MNNLGVILKINPDLTYNIIQIDSNAVDMNNSATLQYNYTSKFYSNDLSFDELTKSLSINAKDKSDFSQFITDTRELMKGIKEE